MVSRTYRPSSLLRLVEGGPHQAEVLLGGIGPGEALAGGALGHEVEQALPGAADDGDDVGALAGGVLGLRDVLVDVAGGDDEVDPRLAGCVADLGDHPLALDAATVDLLDAPAHRLAGGGTGPDGVPALGEAEGHRTRGGLLGQHLEVVGLAAEQGVPHRERQPVLETDVGAHHVGEAVDPRGALGVRTREAREAQGGALDAHGGVSLGRPDDRLADAAREGACLADLRGVEAELPGGLHSRPSKSPRTPALPRRSSMAYAAWPGT